MRGRNNVTLLVTPPEEPVTPRHGRLEAVTPRPRSWGAAAGKGWSTYGRLPTMRHDLGRTVWDFAVEIDALEAAGVTRSDLRWMVCLGYLEHAEEVPPGDDRPRSFRHETRLCLGKRSCFVLTSEGIEFVRSLLRGSRRRSADRPSRPGPDGRASLPKSAAIPTWDRDRQELRVGDVVVKQFKVPAMNQERILAAFEEDGWPVHLDDPLSPVSDQDPKRRLHDTINSLNRSQKNPLIRFVGDGSGQGIRWEFASSGGNGELVKGSLTR